MIASLVYCRLGGMAAYSDCETPRVQQARALSQQRLTDLDRRRVQFLNASGVNLAMTGLYGRAPAGARVVGQVPQHDGPHVTILGALGVRGLHAVMTVDGATATSVGNG